VEALEGLEEVPPMKVPRTIDLPAELAPFRIRIRRPHADKPGKLAYLQIEVSATGWSAGDVFEPACSSPRCCGRPKAAKSTTPDPQETIHV
jgi:hypothetical protein